MRPGIYMGISEVMNGYNLYDPVAMVFFEATTAVFDEFAFGNTNLIKRVSGQPTTIPREWIEKLNQEWEEKYKSTQLAQKLGENPSQPHTRSMGAIAELHDEEYEENDYTEPIDPNSPVIEAREPEVSNGQEPIFWEQQLPQQMKMNTPPRANEEQQELGSLEILLWLHSMYRI